ncbi:MAG: cytidine deaminase [Fimbriimonadaceae bacterium]|nr:cytidine deaminase [Fimbriimonadaceae bacterium]
MTASQREALVEAARAVRARAYAPYSRYPVGAAVLASGGQVYVGTNVENVSFGLTACAERGAISAMVAGGVQRAVAVAVVTRDGGTPCGMCRQVLAEFAVDPGTFEVVMESEGGDRKSFFLAELLPHGFSTEFGQTEG